MQNPAARAIAKLFAEQLIKFKGTDKLEQNETNLTLAHAHAADGQ